MRSALLLALVLALVAPSAAGAQSAKEHVTFRSLDKALAAPLTATYTRPPGAGPFPAMVLLHTCAGFQPYLDDWAAWFVSQGYAALIVDSFGPRGVRSVCAGGRPTMRTRAADALAALAYLRTRPEIDGARIGDIGWSHGAGTAYLTDNAAVLKAAGSPRPFAATVALYPPCNSATSADELAAPLLFLLGADDDWTPAADCQTDADRLSQGAIPVAVHVYPGVTHAFDNPADRGLIHVGANTHTLNYDASAARDAHDRVKAFLAQYLK